MKKIICLYGGPGSGKSTVCAGLFYKLKMLNFNCEMNREYIKEWVWEDRKIKNGDQTYFFSKQSRKERLYMDKNINFIITDSPLVLTHFYGIKYDPYEQKTNTSLMMLKNHHEICKDLGYKVEHFFIKRNKEYNNSGRLQTKDQALLFDDEIKTMLNSLSIKYTEVLGNEQALEIIINNVIDIPFSTINK